MEAPEKIYIQLPSRNWIGRTWNETPIKEGDNPNWKNATNIEYTRTDAFIEKACKYLQKEVLDDYPGVVWEGLIKEFKDYMKGE